MIVHSIRLPRVVLALCVGAALAVAGALMQAVAANPLAAPEIMGVNAGAVLVVVLAVTVVPSLSGAPTILLAFGGAAAAGRAAGRSGAAARSSIGIISLGGRAGTGKSALALCAGLEAVLERPQHSKVVVFRPLYAVGGQELGYIPGTEGEKMAPWAQAVFDTLGALTTKAVIEEVLARGLLEVLPLTHIRGRSLHDAFVVVDRGAVAGTQCAAYRAVPGSVRTRAWF